MKKLLLAGVTLLSIGALAPLSAQQASSPSKPNNAAPMAEQQNTNAAQPSRDEIMQAQKALDQKGFSTGKADGVLGPETKAALTKFQQQQKLQQTGQLDNATLQALGIAQGGATSTTGQAGNQPNIQSQPGKR